MDDIVQLPCQRCGRSRNAKVNVGTEEHPRYFCIFCYEGNRHKIDGTDVLFSRLAPKEIGDLRYRQKENGVELGFNYYYYSREYGVAVIEFGILNKSGQSIEVLPTDFAFTYTGQPVHTAQLEFEAAARALVDRGMDAMEWLNIRGSPAVPYEVVLLLPLQFPFCIRRSSLYLQDLAAWRRGKRALREIAFDYGTVKSGEFKHGLIFFHVDRLDKQDVTWPENWNLNIHVLNHQVEPQVSPEAITYKYVPYLPSVGCSVLIVAVQFASLFACLFAGLAWTLAGHTSSPTVVVVPLICGVVYLVFAALLILALAIG